MGPSRRTIVCRRYAVIRVVRRVVQCRRQIAEGQSEEDGRLEGGQRKNNPNFDAEQRAPWAAV